ncbi:anti-sigma factor [Algiphilus sp.]|uniref:anti-sigma factor n=1 Tax=Algiphilus sp. TaxID=1872431 RepID=UPI0025B91F63|nr:anti-sigma factor [Algiphilus sp.]MCK5770022.1 anti-sigma factor [Algiphilus sp.]
MIPTRPETRALLAAEYVLGTLQGRARTRFERYLAESDALQREVAVWEAHLHTVMTRDLEPVTPPDALRARVMARVAPPGGAGAPAAGRPRSGARRGRRRVWYAAAAAAALAVLALLLPVAVQQPDAPVVVEPQPEFQPLKRIELAEADGAWEVGVRGDQPIVAAADDGVRPPAGKDYELWWVSGVEGEAPVSLGVLPRTGERTVSVPAEAAGLDTGALAISREPEGGAPEGTPTEVIGVFPL